jgi:hypothetical protein
MKYTLSLLACVSLTSLNASAAQAVDAKPLEISRIGDLELSCGELAQEAQTMSDIINTTEDIKDRRELQGKGVTAVGAVASFLVGTVTGGVGLAAAGFLAERQLENREDEADQVQDIAEQRRSLMMGIYNAKGCLGPVNPEIMRKPQHAGNTNSRVRDLDRIETASGTQHYTRVDDAGNAIPNVPERKPEQSAATTPSPDIVTFKPYND